MDSVGNVRFDVEAQESFLGTGLAEAETSATNANVRKAFSKIVLLVRSTELFRLAAANAGSSSSIATADYSVIGSPHQEHVLIQVYDYMYAIPCRLLCNLDDRIGSYLGVVFMLN